MISYRIPLQGIKCSTNKIYAGTHWRQRKTLKDSILDYAASFCRPTKAIDTYPVEISYRFIFGSRPLDTLNCAYMAKMFEDALRSLGVLKDDDIRYVKRSVIEVDKQPANGSKAITHELRSKDYAPDEDWLEIYIQPYEPIKRT